MSRGRKISLYMLFLIYVSAAASAALSGTLRSIADAFGSWRDGSGGFPTGRGAAAAALAAAVVVLAYAIYYIFAESRKYFSMAPRSAMWLVVFTAAAPWAARELLAPALEGSRLGISRETADRILVFVPPAAVALAATVMIARVRAAVLRAARAASQLAEGKSGVRMNQPSGDELQSLAVAVNSFAKEYSEHTQGAQRRDESYMKFIPQHLVSLMGASSIEDINRGAAFVREMSVLAMRFTLPGEVFKGEAGELFAHINEITTRCAEFVHKNGGAIYNFYYDGFDAVFDGEATDAVSAAVAMRQDIHAFNKESSHGGGRHVSLRMAIDRGDVMMGVVGDESRLTPAAVSACLNSARSLAKLAGRLGTGLLCTGEVAGAAESYAQRYIGKSSKTAARRVYEIFDGDEIGTYEAKEKTRARFAEGVYTLYARDFQGAKRIFMDIVRANTSDGVSRYYLFLADRFDKEPETDTGEEEQLYLS